MMNRYLKNFSVSSFKIVRFAAVFSLLVSNILTPISAFAQEVAPNSDNTVIDTAITEETTNSEEALLEEEFIPTEVTEIPSENTDTDTGTGTEETVVETTDAEPSDPVDLFSTIENVVADQPSTSTETTVSVVPVPNLDTKIILDVEEEWDEDDGVYTTNLPVITNKSYTFPGDE